MYPLLALCGVYLIVMYDIPSPTKIGLSMISAMSYEIYICHGTVLYALKHYLPVEVPAPTLILMVYVFTLLMGYVIKRFVGFLFVKEPFMSGIIGR